MLTPYFHQALRCVERQDYGASCLVGNLRQAPSAPVVSRAVCAGTAHLRLRGGAQLVRLWCDQDGFAMVTTHGRELFFSDLEQGDFLAESDCI